MRPQGYILSCGACGLAFEPGMDLPAACPECSAPLTATRREIRAATLEARARKAKATTTTTRPEGP